MMLVTIAYLEVELGPPRLQEKARSNDGWMEFGQKQKLRPHETIGHQRSFP